MAESVAQASPLPSWVHDEDEVAAATEVDRLMKESGIRHIRVGGQDLRNLPPSEQLAVLPALLDIAKQAEPKHNQN